MRGATAPKDATECPRFRCVTRSRRWDYVDPISARGTYAVGTIRWRSGWRPPGLRITVFPKANVAFPSPKCPGTSPHQQRRGPPTSGARASEGRGEGVQWELGGCMCGGRSFYPFSQGSLPAHTDLHRHPNSSWKCRTVQGQQRAAQAPELSGTGCWLVGCPVRLIWPG